MSEHRLLRLLLLQGRQVLLGRMSAGAYDPAGASSGVAACKEPDADRHLA